MMERFPDRPKGMHGRTYDRLRRAHDIAYARSTMGFDAICLLTKQICLTRRINDGTFPGRTATLGKATALRFRA